MSTEITNALASRMLQGADRAMPAAAQHVKAAAPAADVKVPPKAEIRYDPAEMRRNLEEAIQRLNEQMRQNARNLNFSIDELANRTVITVKSSETGEVIRQIPNETVLKVAHNIEQLKGVLHNETT